MPTNLKKRTRDFLLITFDPFYDWRIYEKLVSNKILRVNNEIKSINEKKYRKLL